MRFRVRFVVPGTVRQMLALLLISCTLSAGLVCQIHITSSDHEHATPGASHTHSAASSLLDFACLGMAAILPTLVLLTSFLPSALHTLPLRLQRLVFAFLHFIPPRLTAH